MSTEYLCIRHHSPVSHHHFRNKVFKRKTFETIEVTVIKYCSGCKLVFNWFNFEMIFCWTLESLDLCLNHNSNLEYNNNNYTKETENIFYFGFFGIFGPQSLQNFKNSIFPFSIKNHNFLANKIKFENSIQTFHHNVVMEIWW